MMNSPRCCCAFISMLLLPVFTPPVNIHAPVVIAALISPFPKTCLSFGWSSKFWRPPCTEMRSLGSSSCHSLVIRCRRRSGFVSKDTRTYCRNKGNSREKKIGYTHWFLMQAELIFFFFLNDKAIYYLLTWWLVFSYETRSNRTLAIHRLDNFLYLGN